MTQTVPEDGQTPAPEGKIAEFLRLAEAVDSAGSDAEKRREAQANLDQFEGSCDPADRTAIKQYFLRLLEFQNVESSRALAHSKITRVLNWLPHTVGSAAEPIARLSGETMRLIASTLGLTAFGLYKGAKTTYDVFRTAS